jgi:hypothetical protein
MSQLSNLKTIKEGDPFYGSSIEKIEQNLKALTRRM